MKELNVAILQFDIQWEDKQQNLYMIEHKVKQFNKQFDLLVLPEMFTTGFTMNAEKVAEEMTGDSIEWMKSMSQEYSAAICGSLVIKEEDSFKNRFIWVEPSGEIKHYDKRHLFSLAGEDESYEKGMERIIIDYNGWRICPQICYDLRFPVWSSNENAYDLLIYVANWPEKRSKHWIKLLEARAIENQSFVIGVNRCGEEPSGLNYTGDSRIVDPLGISICSITNEEGIHLETLEISQLKDIRRRLPFLADQDSFSINY